MLAQTDLTGYIRPRIHEIRSIIEKGENVILKISSLRRIARTIIRDFIRHFVNTVNIDELNGIIEEQKIENNPFLTRLDGVILASDSPRGKLLIATTCPMAPLFNEIRSHEDFISQYTSSFKNEGFAHPLCIVHQVIREELLSWISKGPLFTHPLIVAARDVTTDKIAISKRTQTLLGLEDREIRNKIERNACMFVIL